MTTPLATPETAVPFSEIVEAQGHLIDSHIMERIFDTVVEFGGRFAGVGYSLVPIGFTARDLPCSRDCARSKIAFANPHHETEPPQVIW